MRLIFLQVVTNFKHSVTSLCVCGVHLWVGTAKGGIRVYDALNPKNTMIAFWNEREGMYNVCKPHQERIITYVGGKTRSLPIFPTHVNYVLLATPIVGNRYFTNFATVFVLF